MLRLLCIVLFAFLPQWWPSDLIVCLVSRRCGTEYTVALGICCFYSGYKLFLGLVLGFAAM